MQLILPIMITMRSFLALTTLLQSALVLALPEPINNSGRSQQNAAPTVDLGYEIYQGKYNAQTGLNSFLGVRYAQDTSGANRWQAPKAPLQNRTNIISAVSLPPRCPQGLNSPPVSTFNYAGTEDCLFLSVASPANATNLPVYVWIHGGGYGEGQGNQDLTYLIEASGNAFVGVVIQYRLAAFGFLSSAEVAQYGTPNAGLLDQHFALEWVQKYISKFGGDPRRVTISGESAGGGSVMLQVMANGGTEGTTYFNQAAAQSPYLPFQYAYNASPPTQSYHAFAAAAGCNASTTNNCRSRQVFDCLVGKSTEVLQKASSEVSSSGNYGTFAFLPVTDGKFVQDIPSRQLAQGKVNGIRLLSGNNADEGPAFVSQNITTENDFIAWLHQIFPMLDDGIISQVLEHYPISNYNVGYATSGTGGPGATALDTSQFATGQQQRANNLYAEVTFVCPSYWLPEAFTLARSGGYHYQFSPPPSLHASDVNAFSGPEPSYVGPDFYKAFQTIYVNFITTGNPSISSVIANGARNGTSASNPSSEWPKFSSQNPYMINLNETGGVLKTADFIHGIPATYYADPGRKNAISLADAGTWEGGRGTRCRFWRSIGTRVPE